MESKKPVNEQKRDTVLIVGSGMMGAGIAACSAAAGNRTVLTDVTVERAQAGVAQATEKLHYLKTENLLSETQEKQAQRLLGAAGCDEQEAGRVRLAIEAVSENLALKQQVFAGLDGLLPPFVPIASNTSGLRITDIARDMKHPGRAVTAHFWFPAHLVPLVEVVIGEKTEPEFAVQLKEELKQWGKAPVLVQKDLPGQLANRILQAVIREAVHIVEMGLATPEDVDTAVKMGMGIRFPVWGPLEHVDTVGIELCGHVQDTVLPEISREPKASPCFGKMLSQGHGGVKTGQGFYDWQTKDHEKLQALRDAFIVNAVQFLRKNVTVPFVTSNTLRDAQK